MSDELYDDMFAEQAMREGAQPPTAVPAGEAPYDDFFKQAADQNRAALRGSLGIAIPQNPESAAKRKALADKTGVPVDVVERNEESVAIEARIRELQELSRFSPILARQLSDPKFAALAHDDAESLSTIEQAFNRRSEGKIGGPAFKRQDSMTEWKPTMFDEISRQVSGSVRALGAGLATDFNAAAWGVAEGGAKLVGADTLGGFFNEQRKGQEALGKRIQGDYGSRGFIEQGVASGFRSFGNMLPATIASVLTGNPAFMLNIGSATAGGQAVGKGLDKGIEPWRALAYGAEDAVAERVTEMIPVGRLFKDLKAGTPFFKMLGMQMATEIPTELAATTWQNFNEWANVNPDKSFEDYTNQLGPDLAQTVIATVTQTILSAGMAKGTSMLAQGVYDQQRKADIATQEADALGRIGQLIAANKLRARDPQTFQEFVAAANEDGAVQDIYLDARTLQQAGIDPALLAQASPSVAEQIEQALATGGDLVVPMAEYAARIAGTDLDPLLTPHLRTAEDALSLDEAQRFYQGQAEEFQKVAAQVMEEKATDTAWTASAKAVEAKLFEELKGAGRFTDDVNTAYATLMRDFYVATASRLGITPEEMFARYPLRVAAERMAGGAQRMEQGARLGDYVARVKDGEITVRIEPGNYENSYWVTAIRNGAEIGSLALSENRDDPTKLSATQVAVDENERRKGVASAMYDAAVSAGVGVIVPDTKQSAEARAMWGRQKEGIWKPRSKVRAIPGNKLPAQPNPLQRFAQSIAQALGLQAEQPQAPPPVEPAGPALDMGQFFQGQSQGNRAEIALDQLEVFDAAGKRLGFIQNQRDPARNMQRAKAEFPNAARVAEKPASVISLFATADLSSFLHEMGHFQLEVLAHIAGQPNAPAEIVQDMEKVLKWFGIRGDEDVAGGETAGSLGQGPIKAVRAEPTGKISPITRKPIFELFGENGQRIGLSHSFDTADEAVAGHNAPKQAAPSAPTYTLPEQELPKRSNWKQVKGQKFTALDEDDGYLYHITAAPNAAGIREDGLAPNSGGMFGGGAYANYSAGKVFLTERSGVSFWEARVEDQLFSNYDKPPAVVVMRIPKDKVTAQLTPDDVGTKDARARAYYATDTLFQGDDTQATNPDGLPKRRTALEVWRAMSLEEKRPYHEMFARGFEAYLFEGKSPNPELNGLFRRFRDWLVQVYKSVLRNIAANVANPTPEEIAKAMQSEINPELRGVFDRLIATDEAIKQAEAMRGYQQTLAEDAEATQEAIEQLQRRSLRDMRWQTGARGRILKQMQKDAKAKRQAVEDEVRAEVRAMPVYAAMRFIRYGEMADADLTNAQRKAVDQTAGMPTKLELAALKEMYGEGTAAPWRYLSTGKNGIAATEGLAPDLVAELFGFTSGDHLVREIIAAAPEAEMIEGMTDQRVLERYGDLASPDTLARAVDEAIHNEARGRAIATHLQAVTGAVGPVRVLTKAAKDFAEAMIARKKVKDIKPRQHAAAETRAAKAAQKATDPAVAAQEIRNQLVQHHATRAAYDALDEIGKARDFFKRVITGKDDQVLKTRDLDVVNAARAILAAYGFGQKAKTAAEYLKVVQANDPETYAVLKDRVDSAVADARPFNELTLEEMRGLRDEVEAMWYLAERNRHMEVDGDLLDRQEVQAALRERMEEIGIPDKVPGEGSAITPAEERLRKLQTLRAAARRVESWAEAKDGTAGARSFWRYVWNTIKDPANRYRADKAKALKALREAFDAIPGMQRGLIDAPEIGYTFGKDVGGVGMSELMHALLHTGNPSNLRKMLLGRKWATENGDGTLNTAKWDAFIERMHQEGRITKAHYDARQKIWDILESLKPQAQKAHRDVFGKYFAEVTAEAQVTPFGTYRGGYVPAIADTRIVNDAALRKLAEQENEGMAYAFPTTSKGFTKSRTEYNRPLLLDLRTLAQHIDKVLLFSHLEQPVRDVRRVLMSPEVSQALTRIDPAAYDGMLIPWLNRAAKQQVETPIPGDRGLMRVVSMARQRAGMAAMFANVSNTAQQITGFSLAAIKVKPRYLLGAVAEYAKGPKAVAQTVAEASPYMATRMENEVAQMIDGINDILLDPSLYEKGQAWAAKHAYFMQSAIDNVMSPIVWLAAYNEALETLPAETKDEARESDAKRIADGTVRQTQGSTQPEDVSRIETGIAFWRLFAQFAGYFNMQANVLGTAYGKTVEELGVRKGAGKMLYITMFGFLAPAWIAEAIAQMFRGGPDDEDRDGEYLDDWLMAVFGFGTLRTATAMIPVAGQGINAAVNAANSKPYDDRIATAPAVSMIESAVRSPWSVYKAIVEDASKQKAVKDVATLITLTTGLPASALARPIGYGVGVASGEIRPENEADFARGVISGAKGMQK